MSQQWSLYLTQSLLLYLKTVYKKTSFLLSCGFSQLLIFNKTLHYPFIQQTSFQSYSGRAEIGMLWERGLVGGLWVDWVWCVGWRVAFAQQERSRKLRFGLRNYLQNISLLSNAVNYVMQKALSKKQSASGLALLLSEVRWWATDTTCTCGTVSVVPQAFYPDPLANVWEGKGTIMSLAPEKNCSCLLM